MSQGREIMKRWVLEALDDLGGSGRIVDVCRIVWTTHECDIRAHGDLLYTWQYEIRWATAALRKEGKLAGASEDSRGVWTALGQRRPTD